MGGITPGIPAIEGKGLGFHIIDQPDRVIGLAEGLNHRLPDSQNRFHLFPFVRNIRGKNIENPAVGICFRIVAVIIHPADFPVSPDDAVFHMIQFFLPGGELTFYLFADCFIIVGMDHPTEGVAGQCFKVFGIFTAKNAHNGPVGIKQLSGLFRPVDEEPAWHVPADCFHNGERLLIQLKMFSKHSEILHK